MPENGAAVHVIPSVLVITPGRALDDAATATNVPLPKATDDQLLLNWDDAWVRSVHVSPVAPRALPPITEESMAPSAVISRAIRIMTRGRTKTDRTRRRRARSCRNPALRRGGPSGRARASAGALTMEMREPGVLRGARALLDWIEKTRPAEIEVRVAHRAKSGTVALSTAEKVVAALRYLQDHGHVRPVPVPKGETTPRWEVNPAAYDPNNIGKTAMADSVVDVVNASESDEISAAP